MLFPLPDPPTPPHRVVITGAGIVTALGLGWRANADGFRVGRPAFRPVTLFDATRQRTKIAAEVDLPKQLPSLGLSSRRLSRLDRATKMLLLAAYEAWDQAGWQPCENLPLVLGTTGGGMSLGEAYLQHARRSPLSQRQQPTRVVNYQAQRQALDVCDALRIHGPVRLIANACASGANALGHAWELLRAGRAHQALAGGYDALSHLIFAGFDSLQAMSPTPCRPFATQRDGLSLGEGAAILALETLSQAKRRGAVILGEIIGYGAATDIYHLTQPHPQGDVAFRTMNLASAAAGITPEQVDYVNAHGTATLQNDSTEAAAINRWAGPRAAELTVSSTKACIGHTLGAAGAVEAVVCLMTLCEQWLPPEMTISEVDPACEFAIVRQPTETSVEVALSNSFGFGGANATLIFRRWI